MVEDVAETYTLKEKAIVLLAASLGWAHDAIGLTIINFLAVPIMEEFNVGKVEMGLIFSGQYIATVFGAILFGELADRFGRKHALVISILWDSILTAASAFAPNYWVLAALRIISGMGVSWGIAFALLSEIYSPKRRGLFGGVVHATFCFGYIASALTVTIMYPIYGWRPCFFIALFPIPILLLLEFALPESKLWEKYKEIEEEVEVLKTKVRISELFKSAYFKLTILCAFLFWTAEFAYHAVVDWAPTFLSEEWGFAVEEASSLVLLVALEAVIILPLIGLISDFIGRRASFAASAFIGLIGTIMLGYFTLIMRVKGLAIVSLFIIAMGFGSHALFGVWSSEIFPTKVRATATSFIFSVARGLSLGGLIIGYFSTLVGLTTAMLLAAPGFILMIILPMFLPETKGKVLKAVEEPVT